MIVIVDYGMGNLRSILKKCEMIKIKALVSSQPDDIERADKLIFPGVGHFAEGMKNIHDYGLLPILTKKVIEEKTPILGICLGMQLFAEWSEEGDVAGLGWIKGKIVRFHFDTLAERLNVPHVGWNTIEVKQPDSILLKGIDLKKRFYFTHSYHWEALEAASVVANTLYGYEFPSILQQENIYGTQFHPEKSHLKGLEIIRNFAEFA